MEDLSDVLSCIVGAGIARPPKNGTFFGFPERKSHVVACGDAILPRKITGASWAPPPTMNELNYHFLLSFLSAQLYSIMAARATGIHSRVNSGQIWPQRLPGRPR